MNDLYSFVSTRYPIVLYNNCNLVLIVCSLLTKSWIYMIPFDSTEIWGLKY